MFINIKLGQGPYSCKNGISSLKIRQDLDFNYTRKLSLSKYLNILVISKYRMKLSSHRLEVRAGRWAKSNRIHLDDRKCHTLEAELPWVLECPLYTNLRRQCIEKYFGKRPNMPTRTVPNRQCKTFKTIKYNCRKLGKNSSSMIKYCYKK